MPAMDNHHLPPCCSPLNLHWPWPHAEPALRLVSTRFDPAQLSPDDFRLCAIEPVRGVAKRQAEYLAGRLCARHALALLTGSQATPGRGTDRAPRWPEGTLGAITHGHGWAAAVAGETSQWRGLGLDVEQIMPADRAKRLMDEILTPAERVRLETLPPEQHAAHISLTFSCKESLFKALYPQVLRHFYFQDAELLSVSADQRVRLRLLIDLHPDWPAGSEFEGQFTTFDGYLLSLVSIPR